MPAAVPQSDIASAARVLVKRNAADIADTQLKLVHAALDRSLAYANFMLLGGYAGFFGLWQLTKEYLTKPLALWSALFVLISLIAFILFEIYKMVVTTTALQKKEAILLSRECRADEQLLAQTLEEYQTTQERAPSRHFRVWCFAFGLSFSTAVIGAVLLAYAFIIGLAK